MPQNSTPLYKPHIFEFEDLESLYTSLYERLEGRILDIEAETGLVRILCESDETLIPLYHKLSRSGAIDWHAVELFLPNELHGVRMEYERKDVILRRNIGEHVIQNAHLLQTFLQEKTVKDSLESYNDVLESLDGVFFDISVVTVREDGSIISLFPHAIDADEYSHTKSTESPYDEMYKTHLTLSPTTLLNSREIFVVINPQQSIATIRELLDGSLSVKEFPAKCLFSHPYISILYCPQN